MATARIESLMVQELLPSWWEIKLETRRRSLASGDSIDYGSQEMVESALTSHNSSVKGSRRLPKNPEDNASKTEKLKAFIKEEVVVGIYMDVFPCTTEKFFDLILSDDSNFTNEYCSTRKDSNLLVHCRWHLETIDENSCMIDINVGVHFKKWRVMQSTIKARAMNEYKNYMEVMLEVARSFVKSKTSRNETHVAAPSASTAESSC